MRVFCFFEIDLFLRGEKPTAFIAEALPQALAAGPAADTFGSCVMACDGNGRVRLPIYRLAPAAWHV